jgi:hypothetical protein
MLSLFAKLAAPRLQVPFATTSCLTCLALVLMQILELPDLVPGTSLYALVAVPPAAYLVATRLFVTSKNPRDAYPWAILGPVVLAVLVANLTFLSGRSRMIAVAGIITSSHDVLLVSLGAAGVGLTGSAILVLEVLAAASAMNADPASGARHFSAVSWALSFGMASLAFALGDDGDKVVAAALAALAVSAVLLQLIAHRRARVRVRAAGPYRELAARS